MLDGAMLVWFVLTAFSVAFVAWDSVTNGVTSRVQRLAWILVTFYTGPVGAFFYIWACRRPFPGAHDAYTKATWKQGLNSEMHCLAGEATKIRAVGADPVLGLGQGRARHGERSEAIQGNTGKPWIASSLRSSQ